MKKLKISLTILLILLLTLFGSSVTFADEPIPPTKIPEGVTFVEKDPDTSRPNPDTILISSDGSTATLLGNVTAQSQWTLDGKTSLDYPTNDSEGTKIPAIVKTINLDGYTYQSSNNYSTNYGSGSGKSYLDDYLILFNGPSATYTINGPGTVSVNNANDDAFPYYTVGCRQGDLNILNSAEINWNFPETETQITSGVGGAIGIGADPSDSNSVTASVTIGGNSSISSTKGNGIALRYGSNSSGTPDSVLELNVNNCTVSGGNNAIQTMAQNSNTSSGTLKTNLKETINIGENGTNPTISCEDNSAIALLNKYAKVNIFNGTITGATGIEISGGTLNVQGGTIKGTKPDYSLNPSVSTGEVGEANGSAILIDGNRDSNNPIDKNQIGDVNVTISGGILESISGYAVDQNNTLNGGSLSNITNKDVNTLTSLKITGGQLYGSNPENGPIRNGIVASGTPNATASPATGIISQGSTAEFYGNVPSNYLSGQQIVVVTKGENGEPVNRYFNNLNNAKNFVNSNGGAMFLLSAPTGGTAVPDVFIPPSATQIPNEEYPDVISVSLGDNLLSYSQTNAAIKQQLDIGFTIVPNNIPATELDWEITSLNSSQNSVSFNSTVEYGEGSNGLYSYLTSQNGDWQIKQYYSSNGNMGPAYLFYNGTDTNFKNGGIYQLTVTVPEDMVNTTVNQNAITDSIRLTVTQSNVTSVTLTKDGATASSTATYDISETPTVQYGYALNSGATNNPTSVVWNLVSTENNETAFPYASISSTGLIRFRQPTTNGVALLLSVTVDGITSNQVLINVTGEVDTDVTEIAPFSEQVNVVSSNPYDLSSNVYMMPGYEPLPDLDNLSFTSDNNQVIIYNNNIIAPNSNFTGPVEVTATYTNEDGTTATTTFTVNFVSKAVEPTGVAAKETISMSLDNTATQNVEAYLTPENNTAQITPESFNYVSSNESIVYVDELGNVYANNVGTATITSEYVGGTLSAPATNIQPVYTAKTTVTVTETPSDVPATSITANPTDVYLAPSTEAEADHSKTITVTTEPENTTDEVTYTVSPQSVATVTDNGDGTYTVTARDEGRATITFTAGDVSATVNVLVSDEPVIAESITASGTTPDTFTVNVNNVGPNPAIHATGANISHVSIFTWSGPDQVDRQCKAVPNDGTGNYSYTSFEVNGNQPNTWYFNADNIYVQCYANVDGQEVYLGAVTPNYKWVNAGTAGDHHVAYITYQENRGFNVPTVFDGAESGVTGQHLQLEGLRVSSNIEGVDVVTEVHAQNIGWMEAVDDGVYAGTQHEARQIEAIRLRLVGENADNYTICYQVHAENIGWTGPVTNGEVAGTVGQNRQIESVQIQIVPKGSQAIGWATN